MWCREEPMPPNTILLSGMMRELSATPGFTDALLDHLNEGTKKGPALMTQRLIKRLREMILGNDWRGIDRFPGWTMQEVNPAVGSDQQDQSQGSGDAGGNALRGAD